MNIITIHPTMRGCIGVHRALIRMGFPSNNIFVVLNEQTKTGCCVLRADSKEFWTGIGPYEKSFADFKRLWEEVANAINSGGISAVDVEKMYKSCVACKYADEFIAAIQKKGITVPNLKGIG